MDHDEREEVLSFFNMNESESYAKCKMCYGKFEYEDGAALVLHMEYQHEKEWNAHKEKKENKKALSKFFDFEDDDIAECRLCERNFELVEEKDYSVLEIHMSNKHDKEWAAHKAAHGAKTEMKRSSSPTLAKLQETLESLVEEVSALRKEQQQINEKLKKRTDSSKHENNDRNDDDDAPPRKKSPTLKGTEQFESYECTEPVRSSLSLSDNPEYMQQQNEDRRYYQMCIRKVIDNLVRNIKEILPQNGNDSAISSFLRSLKDISGELRPADRVYFNDSTLFGIAAKYAAEQDLPEVPKNALGFLKDCSESHSSLIDSFLMGGVLPSLRIAFMRHWTNGEGSTVEIMLILRIYANIVHGISGRRDDIITMLGAAAVQTCGKNVSLDLTHQLFATLTFMLDAEIGGEAVSEKLQPLVNLIEKEVWRWRMQFLTAQEITNTAQFVQLCSVTKIPSLCYFGAWTLAALTQLDEKNHPKKFDLDAQDRVTLGLVRFNPNIAEATKILLDNVLKL